MQSCWQLFLRSWLGICGSSFSDNFTCPISLRLQSCEAWTRTLASGTMSLFPVEGGVSLRSRWDDGQLSPLPPLLPWVGVSTFPQLKANRTYFWLYRPNSLCHTMPLCHGRLEAARGDWAIKHYFQTREGPDWAVGFHLLTRFTQSPTACL